MCQRPHNREQPTDDMASDGSLPPLHNLTTDPTAVPPSPFYRPLHAADPDEPAGPARYRPLVAVDDEEDFRRPTPDRERSFHQTRDEVVKEEEEPLDKSIGRVERILLGNSAKMGDVTGVANIHACLGLVAAMCEPGGAAEQQLFKFFGIQQFDQLKALKDPSRMMFSILTPLAYKLLETDGGREQAVGWIDGEAIMWRKPGDCPLDVDVHGRDRATAVHELRPHELDQRRVGCCFRVVQVDGVDGEQRDRIHGRR